ncbi:hypothetical protein MTO96_042576 [Rhipicephalus appendiculatus]
MLIHPSYGARRSTAKFTLQGTPIPWKRRVTYLGVQLDHRLRWSPAVKAQLKNARRAISAARALLARGNGCTPSLALRLFNGLAAARILYGLPLAALFRKDWESLDAVHRTAIRQFYSLPRSSQDVLNPSSSGARRYVTLAAVSKTTCSDLFVLSLFS